MRYAVDPSCCMHGNPSLGYHAYSIHIITVKVDPKQNSLRNDIVKPKNHNIVIWK